MFWKEKKWLPTTFMEDSPIVPILGKILLPEVFSRKLPHSKLFHGN